jgi:diaminopimelate decarboxylase
MSITCQAHTIAGASLDAAVPLEVPVQALLEVVRRHGTPTYAYDLERLRAQMAKLRSHLPAGVDVLYSLKANASLGLCGLFADGQFGADVASAGELATALAAGFAPEQIFVSGPDKSPAMVAELASVPGALLSLDSVSELRQLAGKERPHRAVLRLRPDFCSLAHCSAGPDSRFGLLPEDLPACRPYLRARGIQVVGFHVFAGSQVLDAAGIIHHLRGALDQSLRAADLLGLKPEVINLGGGFGIPYGPGERELDLGAIAAELRSLVERAAPARLLLELGRYLVAQAGWYLTAVIAHQTHQGRQAVVVDGGVHQRGDLCGLDLRHKAFAPAVLAERDAPLTPTDVLGCLSLPSDVLAECKPLPSLCPGDVLAFPNAGAYGLTASPTLFHGHPSPAEVVFAGTRMELIRSRPSATSLLDGQYRLREIGAAGMRTGKMQ